MPTSSGTRRWGSWCSPACFFAPLELEDTGGVVETEHVSNYPDIRRRYTFSRYGVPLLTGAVSRGALSPEESMLPIPEEGVHFTFFQRGWGLEHRPDPVP